MSRYALGGASRFIRSVLGAGMALFLFAGISVAAETGGAPEAAAPDEVTISPPGGIYDIGEEVLVQLSHPNAEAAIRYTLDGSEPSADNGTAPAKDGTLILEPSVTPVTLTAKALSPQSASSSTTATFQWRSAMALRLTALEEAAEPTSLTRGQRFDFVLNQGATNCTVTNDNGTDKVERRFIVSVPEGTVHAAVYFWGGTTNHTLHMVSPNDWVVNAATGGGGSKYLVARHTKGSALLTPLLPTPDGLNYIISVRVPLSFATDSMLSIGMTYEAPAELKANTSTTFTADEIQFTSDTDNSKFFYCDLPESVDWLDVVANSSATGKARFSLRVNGPEKDGFPGEYQWTKCYGDPDTVNTMLSIDGGDTPLPAGRYRITVCDVSTPGTYNNSADQTPIPVTISLRAGNYPALANGVATNRNSRHAVDYSYIDVPAGASSLKVTISAPESDVTNLLNLYISDPAKNAPATTLLESKWRSEGSGNSEEITIANPVAGRYYLTAGRFGQHNQASYPYTITATHVVTPVAAPTLSVNGGTFDVGAKVTTVLKSATSGASIRYTTDGTTPSETKGTLVANGAAVTLPDSTVHLRAIAYKTGMTSSAVLVSNAFTRKAAALTITPNGGTFTAGAKVTAVLKSTSTGVSIRYTTDGTTPSGTKGTLVANGATITLPDSTVRLRAIAYKTGATSSAVLVSNVFTRKAALPTLSPNGGTFAAGAKVTTVLESTSPGVSIRYTTDGTAPSSTKGTLVANGATITLPDSTVQLRVIAYKTGITASAVRMSNVFARKAAMPTLSTNGGTFTAGTKVTAVLKSATPGVSIRYTTDGTAPSSTKGTLVANGATITLPDKTVRIRAIAYKADVTASTVLVSNTFTRKAALPTLSKNGGTFTAGTKVTTVLKSASPGVSIRYTTDGSIPSSTKGTLVANGATITLPDKTVRVRAIAYKTGITASAVRVSNVFTRKAATPTVSRNGGTFASGTQVRVVLKSASTGVSIRYTTDGTAPSSTKGTLVANGATITVPDKTVRIRAIAYKSGVTASSVLVSNVFTRKVGALTVSPNGGTFSKIAPVIVTIKSSTAGSTLRYTLDGSTPSATKGTVLGNGKALVLPKKTVTLKVVAYKSGATSSAVVTKTFTRK